MPIFTARENFKEEMVTGRMCQSCHRWIQDEIALVVRWRNKKDKAASLALCNEECWTNYDHNFWIERQAKREFFRGHDDKAERLLESRLPVRGENL